ncbi:MAG: menaquinol-cytochrome c reductase cytochrome b subunit, partial [Acidimicrobiales bacterium]
MTEIPEHLRKRAEEARKKAEGAKAGADDAAPEGAADEPSDSAASKIPAHLLERSRSAKQRQGDEAAASSGG